MILEKEIRICRKCNEQNGGHVQQSLVYYVIVNIK